LIVLFVIRYSIMPPVLKNLLSMLCLLGACWSGLNAAQIQSVLPADAPTEIMQEGTIPVEQRSNTLGFGLSGLLFVLAIAMQLDTVFRREEQGSLPPTSVPAAPLTDAPVASSNLAQTPPPPSSPQSAPDPNSQQNGEVPSSVAPAVQTLVAVAPIIQDSPVYTVPATATNGGAATREDILTKFAASPLGLVFTAPPGTGKTCTELAYLAKLFEQSPDAIVRVVCRKKDAFLGLAAIPRCVELIDPQFEVFFEAINWIHGILHQRLGMPVQQRGSLEPVRQVIGDYYSTANSLSQQKKYRDRWEETKAKLGDINTLGREVNVGAVIDTHSFNTAALGVSDGNIRDCLNIAALGKITRDDNGREDGGYGSIFKAINNKLVVDDDTLRQQLLKRDLPPLQEQSQQTGQPVLFTTMGTPRLMLLPDLRWAETYQLPRATLQRLAAKLGTSLPEEHAT
jgi:hypothetical protein